MDITPIFIVFIIFGSVVAIILGPSFLKSREREATQATVRAAIDKGQPLPPEVIDSLTRDVAKNLPSRSRDLRRGVIWLAVAIGLAGFSLVTGEGFHGEDWQVNAGNGLLGIACIPGAIGIAFIVLSFFNKNKD